MLKMWSLRDEVSADGGEGGGAAPASTPKVDGGATTAAPVNTTNVPEAVIPVSNVPLVPVGEPVPDSNVDWSGVADGDVKSPAEDGSSGEIPFVAKTQAAPVKVETPPAQSTAVAPPVATPAPTTGLTSTVVATTAPTPPTVPQPSNEEVQRQVKESRERFVKQLETMYAVSTDDVPKLVAEPETVIPAMLAKAHMAVMDQVSQFVQSVLPRMIKNVQAQETQVQSALEKFYNAWPELKDPKHGDVVARTLVAYRQANPTATTEQVINEGGVSSLVALRLPIPERIMKLHNVGTPSAEQGAVFQPAAAGSAPLNAPASAANINPFTILAQEDLADN